MLEIENLMKYFPVRGGLFSRAVGYVHAVDGVSLSIPKETTLALVGESGCGKTTLGRSVIRLTEPDGGKITFDGELIYGDNKKKKKKKKLREIRKRMQIIFQDPYTSLNPRMTVKDIIGEPLYINGLAKREEIDERVEEILRVVGLKPEHMKRYPHEFSGGQRQRICIARALSLNPEFIVLDEPTSALDVSVQAQVLNMLMDLQKERHITYLLITHDMGVVKYMADRVAVMYLGEIVEIADKKVLFSEPMHPYTKALLSAIPIPDPKSKRKRIILPGDIPSPINPPSGCRFHTRCPYAKDICSREKPVFKGDGHRVACWLY